VTARSIRPANREIPFIRRIALPGAMAILLLLALAYWWLNNLAHEIFGTALFILLAWHLAVNHHWFKNLFRERYDTRRRLALALHLVLIANMAILVVTSVVISESIFSLLPIPDSIYLREIHWFSAYWVMIIVGIHLGLHWTRVMAVAGSLAGVSDKSAIRKLILRIAAFATAAFGIFSFSALDVWTKLTFTYSLDFWDFSASVTLFFAYWAGVVALPAIITHYTFLWLRKRRPTSRGVRQRLARNLAQSSN
jgi:Domain of unknown function (DUF4405)